MTKQEAILIVLEAEQSELVYDTDQRHDPEFVVEFSQIIEAMSIVEIMLRALTDRIVT